MLKTIRKDFRKKLSRYVADTSSTVAYAEFIRAFNYCPLAVLDILIHVADKHPNVRQLHARLSFSSTYRQSVVAYMLKHTARASRLTNIDDVVHLRQERYLSALLGVYCGNYSMRILTPFIWRYVRFLGRDVLSTCVVLFIIGVLRLRISRKLNCLLSRTLKVKRSFLNFLGLLLILLILITCALIIWNSLTLR